jgi:hypothetical protein
MTDDYYYRDPLDCYDFMDEEPDCPPCTDSGRVPLLPPRISYRVQFVPVRYRDSARRVLIRTEHHWPVTRRCPDCNPGWLREQLWRFRWWQSCRKARKHGRDPYALPPITDHPF